MRILKVAFIVVALPPLLYVLAFAWRFEIFGCPVRDETHGWLGPRVRDDLHCTDIGKVWYRESDDISPYTGVFQPLVVLWLFANDLQPSRTKRPNQSMKPTAPLRNEFSVFATTPCRALSLSR